MGRLLDKNACSGCMACHSVCPAGCIDIVQDANGFSLPQIDEAKCLNCGKCEAACKKANGAGVNSPIYGKAFTTQEEETLKSSSSGGAFTAIATQVLCAGGVVYGAAYDEAFCVKHIRVDSFENLGKLRGSKYVQSDVQNCYAQVKNDLKAGCKVLFSGTPCQVAGLIASLPKQLRENLLAVDFICHGVPTPKAWEAYLNHMQETVGAIRSVNMRDHRLGQENYGIYIVGEKGEYFESCGKDPYLTAFNRNLTLRPACFQCKHKKIKCHSDITMADLWGGKAWISPQRYTGHHSLVIANSPRGAQYVNGLSASGQLDGIPLEKALAVNTSRFYPSTKISKQNMDDVIAQLGNGCLSGQTYSEGLLSKVKRKAAVLGKCLVLRKNKKPE